MTPLDFLNPINLAADAIKKIIDIGIVINSQKDRETTSIIADLAGLMEELRKTHSTIVKLISPLRRIADDPAVFGKEFNEVYNDFRDQYDAYDFVDERTRCHKIQQIRMRMIKRIPLFGSTAPWSELDASLGALSNADFDIIDEQYKPFMKSFNKAMQSINEHVQKGEIDLAIREKVAFLNDLGPDYDRNKRILEDMTNTIGNITAAL